MKVLIIGFGSIAKKHVSALKHLLTEVKIYAFRSSIKAEKIEDIENIYEIRSIIESIDFVIISNPTHLHLNTIEELIQYKKPLFIEKPPLHALEGTEELLKQIKDNNIFTYVACNLRFHASLEYLKEKVLVENINEVNIYCGSYLPDWRPGQDFRKNYSANEAMGGGVHLDLFHEIDYASWIFGFPDSTVSFKSSKSALNIGSVDYANYLWEYSNFNLSIILNYYRPKPKRSIEILTHDDIWQIDLLNNVITSETHGVIFSSEETIMDTYYKQLSYFINCFQKQIQPMNTLEEGVENLKICLANEYEIKG